LKTPLTAVREGAELLRDNVGGRLSIEQQDIVRIVRENTLSLQKLIEDLLTYHQARALEPATLAPVHLVEIVKRVMREQKLAAVARMIDFDTSLAPLVVVGDHEKIRTVIDNLLSNAIKYSPRKGAIEIALIEQDGFAVLDVSDHGPGIAADERDRVFDSFYSGKAPVDGKVKGSGLGLAIAREYAIAQSGRIEVLDRTDGERGVRFRVWLPLSLGAEDAARRGSTLARVGRDREVTLRRVVYAAGACAWLAACATAPETPMTLEEQYEPERVEVPSPFIEYPPIEPVEPPIVASVAAVAGAGATGDACAGPRRSWRPRRRPSWRCRLRPCSRRAAEDVELILLLADLNRYNNLSQDDARRELANVTQVLTRQRTDANRVRLAVLYTLSRASPQDDQRALQLLDNVSRSNPGSPAVKQLAFVLQAQIVGRARAVREEQQKADAALQKLEALRPDGAEPDPRTRAKRRRRRRRQRRRIGWRRRRRRCGWRRLGQR
jgi:signal transduction histidine kinase